MSDYKKLLGAYKGEGENLDVKGAYYVSRTVLCTWHTLDLI